MQDSNIIKAISASPLSKEDKEHWIDILPKLNDDQKTRLLHSLIAKTDIASAKLSIDNAISIIDVAEKEVENESKDEVVEKQKKEELMKKLDESEESVGTPVTKEQLSDEKSKAESRLQDLRDELSNISLDALGSSPPSYNE
jgi:hypothetical protein